MLINNSLFKLGEVPNYSPTFQKVERIDFWSKVRRKIIEGDRQAGKWCPGPLWYGTNFHNIDLEDVEGNQSLGLPSIRDIDWDIYYNFEEARGFSGFSNLEYSCNKLLLEKLTDEDLVSRCTVGGKYVQKIYDNLFTKEGTRKLYKPAYEVIRQNLSDPGKAIYLNDAKNYVILGGRGFGKSVIGSVLGAHNFITDGVTDYDYYLEKCKLGEFPKSTTLLGSEETKYVNIVLTYIKKAFKHYKGSYVEGTGDSAKYHPSPISKSIAVGSDWKLGSAQGVYTDWGTSLFSRVFGDTPLSANSLRPNFSFIDEFGLVKYLSEIHGTLEGSSASKIRKNNVTLYAGTGGQLGKGKNAKYGEALFGKPEAYNCLVFEDKYEGKGKIGYFLPITDTSMRYKDENLNTKREYALDNEMKEREKRKGDNKQLQAYMIANPLVPSECFLLEDNNKFPAALLKQHHAALLHGGPDEGYKIHDEYLKTRHGYIKWYGDKLIFEDTVAHKPIIEFPFDGSDTEKIGCVQMWEAPVDVEGEIPRGRYIGGIDPVDQVKGRSFPCIWIKDTWTQRMVAKFMGRTGDTKYFWEQARRLLVFYNAKGMYENNLVGFFLHMESERSLQYLAETPVLLKSKEDINGAPQGNYGIRNTGSSKGGINEDGLNSIASWLLRPQGPNTEALMYQTIKDPEVLEEMIKWNEDGNYDSLSAWIMLALYEDTTMKANKNNDVQKLKDNASLYFQMRKKELGFVNLYNIKDDEDSTRAKTTTN